MGSRMAANLSGGGFSVTVWNRTAARAEAFASEHPNVIAASTPAAAAAGADVIFTMIVDGDSVREVLLGDQGAAAGAAPGTLFIDCTTIGIAAAREIATEMTDRGFRFLDAPVTGSASGAEDGTLTFMVGGEQADMDAAAPVLKAMGTTLVYAGASGQGQAVKVINNAVAAVNATTVADALVLAGKLGADLDALSAVLHSGSGGSAMAELKLPLMREHDFAPKFKLDHMLKDIRLCLAAAESVDVEFPFARVTEHIFAAESALGRGADDFAAIIEQSEARTGTQA
jgi:3-hydroxyisobutyrate dehydrogenase-like beta-hydroxyacid dehydrogenase